LVPKPCGNGATAGQRQDRHPRRRRQPVTGRWDHAAGTGFGPFGVLAAYRGPL